MQISSIGNFRHLEKTQIHEKLYKGTLYKHNVSHTTDFISSSDRKQARSISTTLIIIPFLILSFFRNSEFSFVRVRGFGSPPTWRNEDTLFLLRMSNKPHTNFKRQTLSHLYTNASTFQVMNLHTYVYTDLYMLMPNINSCIIKIGILLRLWKYSDETVETSFSYSSANCIYLYSSRYPNNLERKINGSGNIINKEVNLWSLDKVFDSYEALIKNF